MKNNSLYFKLLHGSFAFFVILVFCIALKRDIGLEKKYAGDLRNRVVGARLISNRINPYLYKWKTTDGIKFYDPQNFSKYKASNITVTPFFLHLMQPFSNWDESTISKFWLAFNYAMFIAIVTILYLRFSTTVLQRYLIISSVLLILFTQAWISNCCSGQIYLIIPFLVVLFIRYLGNFNNLLGLCIAGIIATSLILIRPNTALIFLPLILILPYLSKKKIIALILPTSLGLLLLFLSTSEQNLWKQYITQVHDHILIHQHLSTDTITCVADPHFNNWEGVANIFYMQYKPPSETGNFFVFLNHFLLNPISVKELALLCLGFITLFSIIFYFRQKRNIQSVYEYSVLVYWGYCLYLISDFFSPIYRHQYNGVQMIFPILLAIFYFQKKYSTYLLFIFLGLLLNLSCKTFVPMQRTLGEYLILSCFIALCFTPYFYPNKKEQFL